MVYEKAKLFWKANNNSKEIFCIPYNDNVEYYTFLKKQHDSGFRQIIITSEIMVKLIEYFVLESKLNIYDIVFFEVDKDLIDEIDNLLIKIENDRKLFWELIDKLNFLSEKSSIDIQRIYFKGRSTDGSAINFYLQSNGIIGINKNNYFTISNEISRLIVRCLFK